MAGMQQKIKINDGFILSAGFDVVVVNEMNSAAMGDNIACSFESIASDAASEAAIACFVVFCSNAFEMRCAESRVNSVANSMVRCAR